MLHLFRVVEGIIQVELAPKILVIRKVDKIIRCTGGLGKQRDFSRMAISSTSDEKTLRSNSVVFALT